MMYISLGGIIWGMKPQLIGNGIRARCPDCGGAVTTFEFDSQNSGHGYILHDTQHHYDRQTFSRILYYLGKCAGCGRGGLAKIHDYGNVKDGALEWFFPMSIESLEVPTQTPEPIKKEFEEAELCASVGARRAGAAMLRSTLEKVLRDHGYTERHLTVNIKNAGEDQVITLVLKRQISDVVKVLGDEVLHQSWREVTEEEFELAHEYTQNILKNFYDYPDTVAEILKEKGRLVEKVNSEEKPEEVKVEGS
ncbi:MAG: hypothetical protein G01um10147_787 [Microgenomates group bacterium Gr01-1014_7]|nr:MAG: hypothetical protein G01um10147_787 [Microgenomates group bacterium Gr01-1014_7]